MGIRQSAINLSRAQIVAVSACPRCKAAAGSACVKSGGEAREKSHRERLEAAQAAIAGKANQRDAGKGPKPKAPQRRDASFYSSWEWKAARYEAIKKHGRRCLCCGWEPGADASNWLVVDHIKPIATFPHLALEQSNLQVLCNDCNMGKSRKHRDDFRKA